MTPAGMDWGINSAQVIIEATGLDVMIQATVLEKEKRNKPRIKVSIKPIRRVSRRRKV